MLERVRDRTRDIDLSAVAVSVLLSPLWLIGAIVGTVWTVFRWGAAAMQTGFEDLAGEQPGWVVLIMTVLITIIVVLGVVI